MIEIPKLSGPEYKPRSGAAAKQLVVIMHGWGADGPNLIDLAEVFAQKLPDAHFIAPNAPYPCEANPFGYQWFSLMDRDPDKMLSGVRNAAEIMDHFLDEQLSELSLDNSKLALVGFSQGTMTALHIALRREPQMAALVGFSGMLLGDEALLHEEAKVRPPVCLIHGEHDEVVPHAALAQAYQTLTKVNVDVHKHSRPMLGHSIDFEGMDIAGDFLLKHFA